MNPETENLTVGKVVDTGRDVFRKALAVVSFALIAITIAALMAAAHDVESGVPLMVAAGIFGIVVWWTQQRDNRAAELAGDKTLITSTFLRDVVVTAVVIFATGFVLGLFQILNPGVIYAGGVAGPVAWYVGEKIWKNR